MSRAQLLVSPEWLNAHLSDSSVAVVDASWYLAAQGRDAKAEYAAGHVPGAVFFDIDAISDQSNALPHMLPTADDFAAAVGGLGISADMTIVIYDGMGLFSAPRVWWTFKVFGAREVKILDGGLPAWTSSGFSTEGGVPTVAAKPFHARYDAAMVADMAKMGEAIGANAQILDARPAGRFTGADPEFRQGLSSGHMPGAHNLPQSTLIKDGRLIGDEALKQAFDAAGIDIDRPLITTCGSGVSAATLTFALAVLGKPLGRLYDGSWTEWAGTPGNPIEKTA